MDRALSDHCDFTLTTSLAKSALALHLTTKDCCSIVSCERKFHRGAKPSKMPEARLKEGKQQPDRAASKEISIDANSSDAETKPSCDPCEGKERAVCYCVDCGDRICHTHLQVSDISKVVCLGA